MSTRQLATGGWPFGQVVSLELRTPVAVTIEQEPREHEWVVAQPATPIFVVKYRVDGFQIQLYANLAKWSPSGQTGRQMVSQMVRLNAKWSPSGQTE